MAPPSGPHSKFKMKKPAIREELHHQLEKSLKKRSKRNTEKSNKIDRRKRLITPLSSRMEGRGAVMDTPLHKRQRIEAMSPAARTLAARYTKQTQYSSSYS